jgi:hypothetical protein
MPLRSLESHHHQHLLSSLTTCLSILVNHFSSIGLTMRSAAIALVGLVTLAAAAPISEKPVEVCQTCEVFPSVKGLAENFCQTIEVHRARRSHHAMLTKT